MPDPPAARAQMRQPSNHQPYREQPSTDSESHVPVPIRVPQSKKSRRQPSQPQYAQEAYATQAAPTSPLVGTPDIGVCIRHDSSQFVTLTNQRSQIRTAYTTALYEYIVHVVGITIENNIGYINVSILS